jgi:hypothetical protein
VRTPALCALALLLAAPAAAVDLVSGDRSVEVDVLGEDGEVQQHEDSADLDPFDESVEVDLPLIEGGVHRIAAQTSSFSASEVVAAGGAFQEWYVSPYVYPYTDSSLELFFDVTSPTAYELSGALSAVSDDLVGVSSTTVLLEEVGGSEVLSLGGPCCFEATELDESGVLPPGSYRLTVEAFIGPQGTVPYSRTSTSTYDLALSFATPAIPAVGPAGRGVLALLLALPAALFAARRGRLSR